MPSRQINLRASAGAVTAEFAMVVIVFLVIVCGVLELARVMYMFNTLQMVTQRAAALAANADFSNAAAMNAVRQSAVFRNSPGMLAMGTPVTDAHVRIDYLSLGAAGGTAMAPITTAALPACPANNRVTCMRDPYDASCVRLVRVRICDPAQAGECRNVRYQALFSFVGMPLTLPRATAIATAETLGAPPGQAPCP
ncbi:MAG TPA: TadE family protein [Duganella sp.]|jgi:Flp pilus assembly protein TadG